MVVEQGEADLFAPAGGLGGAEAAVVFGAVFGGGVEVADAEQVGDGFADAFAVAEAECEAGDVAGEAIEVCGFGDGLIERLREGLGDSGEREGNVETGAAGAGGFDLDQLLGDLVTGEPEGEGLEVRVVLFGDVAEGEIGIGEEVQNVVDDAGVTRVEVGGVGFGGKVGGLWIGLGARLDGCSWRGFRLGLGGGIGQLGRVDSDRRRSGVLWGVGDHRCSLPRTRACKWVLFGF